MITKKNYKTQTLDCKWFFLFRRTKSWWSFELMLTTKCHTKLCLPTSVKKKFNTDGCRSGMVVWGNVKTLNKMTENKREVSTPAFVCSPSVLLLTFFWHCSIHVFVCPCCSIQNISNIFTYTLTLFIYFFLSNIFLLSLTFAICIFLQSGWHCKSSSTDRWSRGCSTYTFVINN